MAEHRTSYGLPELLASGNGDLPGPRRAQLPLPPLLMFERIEAVSDAGGAHGRGQVVATVVKADGEWTGRVRAPNEPPRQPGISC
jgi:3-hydroxyacyl-[acyl-carrier protein] dehydratase / trans-2-decenoyl-[acyl-carrier protein] isomerase